MNVAEIPVFIISDNRLGTLSKCLNRYADVALNIHADSSPWCMSNMRLYETPGVRIKNIIDTNEQFFIMGEQ